jgi:hypothetical protein
LQNIFFIETYALLTNTDSSIKLLNEKVSSFGFEFVSINLKQLEISFSDLFHHPNDYESNIEVRVQNADYTISKKFLDIVSSNELLGTNALLLNEVIFLKSKNEYQLRIENNAINHSESIGKMGEMQKFIKSLVQQLRLFKSGNIQNPIIFQIDKNSRGVVSRLTSRYSNTYFAADYILSAEEAVDLSEMLIEDFKTNSLTELSIANFNLSYEISDVKSKYLLLMMCLESLFNLGKDQIAHTISRHLSIIISNSKDEFQKNYRRTKDLYKIRNSIIHGSLIKGNILKETEVLADLVRQSIRYCLKFNGDKEHLFHKLNACGFE